MQLLLLVSIKLNFKSPTSHDCWASYLLSYLTTEQIKINIFGSYKPAILAAILKNMQLLLLVSTKLNFKSSINITLILTARPVACGGGGGGGGAGGRPPAFCLAPLLFCIGGLSSTLGPPWIGGPLLQNCHATGLLTAEQRYIRFRFSCRHLGKKYILQHTVHIWLQIYIERIKTKCQKFLLSWTEQAGRLNMKHPNRSRDHHIQGHALMNKIPWPWKIFGIFYVLCPLVCLLVDIGTSHQLIGLDGRHANISGT